MQWTDQSFVEKMRSNRGKDAEELSRYCTQMESRIKISFRKDIYDSIMVLANH